MIIDNVMIPFLMAARFPLEKPEHVSAQELLVKNQSNASSEIQDQIEDVQLLSWYLIERVDLRDGDERNRRLETVKQLQAQKDVAQSTINKKLEKFRIKYYALCQDVSK